MISTHAFIRVGFFDLFRVEDYGRVAVAFDDTGTGYAVRVTPRLDVREQASAFVLNEPRHYFAQRQAYQTIPEEDMLTIQKVVLINSVEQIISRPGMRVNCDICGEEIMKEREICCEILTLCRTWAGDGYYRYASSDSLNILLKLQTARQ